MSIRKTKQKSRKTKPNLKSGFTLVELMITMSISLLIMTSVFFNYSKFEDSTALSAAAQEVSVAIRQAQIYGISVKESSTGLGTYGYAYGISFNMADPSKYYIFTDNDANKDYNTGDSTIETDYLRNGVTISKVCDIASTPTCYSTGSARLEITFLRPSTIATIRLISGSGVVTDVSGCKVYLKSPQGQTISVMINKVGQISIQAL